MADKKRAIIAQFVCVPKPEDFEKVHWLMQQVANFLGEREIPGFLDVSEKDLPDHVAKEIEDHEAKMKAEAEASPKPTMPAPGGMN